MPLSSLPPPASVALRVRRARPVSRLRTAGLCLLCVTDAAFSAQAIDARAAFAAGVPAAATTLSDFAMIVFLVGVALTVGVVFRDRYPVQLALIAAGAALAFQLGPTFALIGLMSVVKLRPRTTAVQVGVLVAAVTVFRLWHDMRTQPASAGFWPTLFGSITPDNAWFLAPLVGVALLALFAGVGQALRTRAELTRATAAVTTEREQVSALTDQVSRQAERERLAREIHDGLGHNLSILAIHANALGAMAEPTPDGEPKDRRREAQLRESAQVVQETAARSVNELHGLLDLLRNPGDADIAAPAKTFRDVRDLIDDSVAVGMPIIATVYLDDTGDVDPYIAQTTYRVVQELLTNARKHAPGIGVRLEVRGGPTDGQVSITTANYVPPAAGHGQPHQHRTRTGTGLSGIRERVEHHGGDFAAGVDPQGVYRVSVRLPWAPPNSNTDHVRTP